MNTYLHDRQIKDLFAYSVENNPDPENDLFKQLALDEKTRAFYRVPNDIPSHGSASVFRDHLDSMRFACAKLGLEKSIGFAVRTSDGEIIALTGDFENDITD